MTFLARYTVHGDQSSRFGRAQFVSSRTCKPRGPTRRSSIIVGITGRPCGGKRSSRWKFKKYMASVFRFGTVQPWAKAFQSAVPPGLQWDKVTTNLKMVKAVKVEYLRSFLNTDKAYTWTISSPNLSGTETMCASIKTPMTDGQSDEISTDESFCFVLVYLDIATKRHINTERWLRVKGMDLAASVQHCTIQNMNLQISDQPATATVTPAGFPEFVDILDLVPWSIICTSLREWTVASSAESPGCLNLVDSKLIAQTEWDLASEDTPAIIIQEALQRTG